MRRALTSRTSYSGRASWSAGLSWGCSEPDSCSLYPGTLHSVLCGEDEELTVAATAPTFAEALPGPKATLSGSFPL